MSVSPCLTPLQRFMYTHAEHTPDKCEIWSYENGEYTWNRLATKEDELVLSERDDRMQEHFGLDDSEKNLHEVWKQMEIDLENTWYKEALAFHIGSLIFRKKIIETPSPVEEPPIEENTSCSSASWIDRVFPVVNLWEGPCILENTEEMEFQDGIKKLREFAQETIERGATSFCYEESYSPGKVSQPVCNYLKLSFKANHFMTLAALNYGKRE